MLLEIDVKVDKFFGNLTVLEGNLQQEVPVWDVKPCNCILMWQSAEFIFSIVSVIPHVLNKMQNKNKEKIPAVVAAVLSEWCMGYNCL